MNQHELYCNSGPYGGWQGACNCNARFQNSDEALAALRKKLSGDDEKLDSTPISLTVYAAVGSITVTVREDSIEMRDNNLIAEGATDNATLNDLYTFVNVIGYMTRPI